MGSKSRSRFVAGRKDAMSHNLAELLSGIPVFFVGEEEEVPGWVAPSVAVAIVLTIVALALIYVGRRKVAPSS